MCEKQRARARRNTARRRAEDPDKQRLYMRAWIERNRQQVRDYDRFRYAISEDVQNRKKDRARKQRLNNKHKGVKPKALSEDQKNKIAEKRRARNGISDPERFHELFEKQGRKCAICPRTSPTGYGWHADHDHYTGMMRGVLCSGCNVGLGHLQDSVEVLESAILYLRNPPSKWP